MDDFLNKTNNILSFVYQNKSSIPSFEGKIALIGSLIGAGAIISSSALLAGLSVGLGFLVKKQFDSLELKREELSFKLTLKNILNNCQTKDDFNNLSEEQQQLLINFKNILFNLVETEETYVKLEPYIQIATELLKEHKNLFVLVQQMENSRIKNDRQFNISLNRI